MTLPSVEQKAEQNSVPTWHQAELSAVLRLRQFDTGYAHERVWEEIVTDGAELLDAPMVTRWQLPIVAGKVVNKAGEPLQDIWERGRQAKRQHAQQDQRFWYDYKRAGYEADEQVRFDDDIVPSFIYNTQITFSPYAQDQEQLYGTDYIDKLTHYKRERKYGLIRILYQVEPEVAEVVSISIENSHQLSALRTVAETLGYTLPEDITYTDVLAHHIPLYVQPDNRLEFERKIVNIYDAKLSEQIGGEYKQGRPKYKLGPESYQFVLANQDILAVYNHEIEKLARNEQLVGYELLQAVRLVRRAYMAELYERYEQHDATKPLLVRSAEATDYDVVYQQMHEAAYRVGQRGIRLIGCGTTLDPIEFLTTMSDDDFKQVLTTAEQKYEFNQKMYCVVCQAPPAKDAKKKMCGPCGICRPCDSQLKRQGAA